MALAESLTPEIIGLILAILVPFGIAIYFIAVTGTKLNDMIEDVKELQKDVKNYLYELSLIYYQLMQGKKVKG